MICLWRVLDLEALESISTFYKEWLGGKTTRQAIRDTQKMMWELNEDSYFWAGFVLFE